MLVAPYDRAMFFRDALRQPEVRACSRSLVCCEEQFEDSFAVRIRISSSTFEKDGNGLLTDPSTE